MKGNNKMLKCRCGGEIEKQREVSEVYKYKSNEWVFYNGEETVVEFRCEKCEEYYTDDEIEELMENQEV